MKFWIDGHNLIAAIPDMSLEAFDDEVQLVMRLQRYAWRTNSTALVFFDHGSGGKAPVPSSAQIEVRFAPRGFSADDLIRAAIDGASPGVLAEVVLVTGDQVLVQAARAAGMRAQSSTAFARAMSEALAVDTAEAEPAPPLKPGESDDLLNQFESRYQERAKVARAQRRQARQQGAEQPKPEVRRRPQAGEQVPTASEAANPVQTEGGLPREEQELLKQFESRYETRAQEPKPAAPELPGKKRKPDRGDESLLKQFEARYRARAKRRDPNE
jgi:predicted RNA-binding protein with PIN domain